MPKIIVMWFQLLILSTYATAGEHAVDVIFQQGTNGYGSCTVIDPWNAVVTPKTLTFHRNTIFFKNLQLQGKDIIIQKARLELFLHEEGWGRINDASLELHDGAETNGKPLSVKRYHNKTIDDRRAKRSWVAWDLPVSLVSRWLKDPGTNQGVRFTVVPDYRDKYQFIFSGPTNEYVPQRPKLVISYSFSGNVPPFAPELESDVAGKTFGSAFTLRWKKKLWDPNGTPVTYEAQVGGQDGDFRFVGKAPADKGALTVNTTELATDDSYRIRMRAVDPNGLQSNWIEAPGELRIVRDDYMVWIAPSTIKVTPGQTPGKGPLRIVLAAARNEYESVQVVVHGLTDLKDVDVTLSDLKGPDHAVIPSAAGRLYRVNYVNCKGKGRLPDSMVPFLDPTSGQRIGGAYGAPFDVAAGYNVPVWLELHVPSDAVPGAYHGTLTVSKTGKTITAVPVSLTVWPITLPKTTELLTYFCLSWNKHPQRAYLHSLHEHRMDVWYIQANNGHQLRRDKTGKAVVKWDPELDRTIEAYFDGSLFADGVPGKTYLFGYGMWQLLSTLQTNETDRVAIFKQFEEHYGEKPWIGKVAWFIIDEPKKNNLEKCKRLGQQIKTHSPSIGYLLTTQYHEPLKGLVTIWDPIINKEAINWNAPAPDVYREERKAGRKVINCITVNSDSATSPNLFIHRPGMNTRIWTWVTWCLGHDGIEFWDSSPAPSVTTPKEYANVWGDGSLFYRGLPAELGIPAEIALPSIRLKVLRDGIEDYELLAMLSKKNPKAAARIGRMLCQETSSYDGSFIEPVQHKSWNWNEDGKGDRRVPGFIVWESSHRQLTAARAALADALGR